VKRKDLDRKIKKTQKFKNAKFEFPKMKIRNFKLFDFPEMKKCETKRPRSEFSGMRKYENEKM
jgi:hypothetical protein